MTRLQEIENSIGRIYTWFCRILTPIFLVMVFSDDGLIPMMALYLSGIIWATLVFSFVLAFAYLFGKRRILNDIRIFLIRVRRFFSFGRSIEPGPEPMQIDRNGEERMIEMYCKEEVKISFLEMISLIEKTPNYTRLHSELIGVYKDDLNFEQYKKILKIVKGNIDLINRINNLTKFWTGSNIAKTRDHFKTKRELMKAEQAPPPPGGVVLLDVRT